MSRSYGSVLERLTDSLIAGDRIGGLTLSGQLDGSDDIISVNEALSLCDASISELLDLQSRVRARAVIKAKELLDTPRGQDVVWEHCQPEEA